MKKRERGFIYGASVLVCANLVAKLIGALYKLPLTALIGSEGMGYFNTAYSFCNVFYSAITVGIPVAVSKLTAEYAAKSNLIMVQKVRKAAHSAFFYIGFAASLLMMIFASQLANLIGNPQSVYAITAIGPSVLFVCLMSVERGYWQGLGNMYPTAISEIVLSAVKLAAGMAIASYMISSHSLMSVAAGGAVAGVTLGTAGAYLWMRIRRLFRCKSIGEYNCSTVELEISGKEKRSILAEILRISVPVTIGASVVSLTGLIDVATIIRRLCDGGMSDVQANYVYGNYTGFAMPLFNLAPALIMAVGTTIIPVLSAAKTQGDRAKMEETVNGALTLSSFLALPASIGLSALSFPILKLLYPLRIDEVALSAPLLQTLSLAGFFVCITAVTNSVLQSLGYGKIPVYAMIAGAAVKTAANFILVGMPEVGIRGAAYATIMCYFVTATVNLFAIISKAGIRVQLSQTVIKPVIPSVAMGFAASAVYRATDVKMGDGAVIFAIFTAIFVYFALSALFYKKNIINIIKKRQ